jgi:hypothetical protein
MIERRLPGPSQPIKTIVPEWLVEELRAQGIPVSADGMPDLSRVNVDREGNVSREC